MFNFSLFLCLFIGFAGSGEFGWLRGCGDWQGWSLSAAAGFPPSWWCTCFWCVMTLLITLLRDYWLLAFGQRRYDHCPPHIHTFAHILTLVYKPYQIKNDIFLGDLLIFFFNVSGLERRTTWPSHWALCPKAPLPRASAWPWRCLHLERTRKSPPSKWTYVS